MIYKFILKVRHLYLARVHRSTLYGFSKKLISVILHTLYCKKKRADY